MEEKLVGIVLGGINYSENDKILWIFTLEKGVVSAKIKGVKKAGAKLKFASEPFCFAEFIFLTSNNRRTVKTASLLDSYYALRENIEKYYSASVVVEFIRKFQKEEIVSPDLFVLTANALKDIAYSDLPPKFVTASFLVSALKLTGYGLNFGSCLGCGGKVGIRPFFDADTGGFYCDDCRTSGAREIRRTTYQELENISDGILDKDTDYVGALKLIDYYINEKTDEKLVSLKELVNI